MTKSFLCYIISFMKRLFNIACGQFFISIFPILAWMVLAFTLGDPNISNVFSLTYPLQFVIYLLKAIFGTGANIKRVKNKSDDIVYSSIIMCSILSFIILGTVALCAKDYIRFMNMDADYYYELCLYSLGNLFIQLLFSLFLEKLYFEDKDKIANIHSLIYNILTFAGLIIPSLITKNIVIIISISLSISLIYVIAFFIWQFKKFKFDFNILPNMKYESATIADQLFMLIIYLFGFRNAFGYGEQYLTAINFISLITDAQWDSIYAIVTVAKIDISHENYHYTKALKNAFVLTSVASLSSIVLFFALFSVYQINLGLGIAYLVFQIFDIMIFSVSNNLTSFIQLKHSALKNTVNKISAMGVRVALSFLPTPFCNGIAQVTSGVIVLLLCLIIRYKYYRIENGYLVPKKPEKSPPALPPEEIVETN